MEKKKMEKKKMTINPREVAEERKRILNEQNPDYLRLNAILNLAVYGLILLQIISGVLRVVLGIQGISSLVYIVLGSTVSYLYCRAMLHYTWKPAIFFFILNLLGFFTGGTLQLFAWLPQLSLLGKLVFLMPFVEKCYRCVLFAIITFSKRVHRVQELNLIAETGTDPL